jgi:hypothetical protein
MRTLSTVFAAAILMLIMQTASFSRDVNIEGSCVCKSGASVKFTASETICKANTHDNCTAAKVACVNAYAADCTSQSGTISQSGKACTIGAKC